MKTIAFLLLLICPAQLKAQDTAGIRILNPAIIEDINDEKIYHFYQGQTIIVALDNELKEEHRRWWIQGLILGDHYGFNRNGFALIGVSMRMEPGEYPVCLDFRCNDSDRKNELRVRILKTEFPKTRTSAYTSEPKLRRDKQKNAIDDAFGRNGLEDDLTEGSPYIDPLDKSRDVADPFGLIYANNQYRTHSGVDLRAKVGTPVKAVNRGKVILVAKMFRREGNMLIISHGLDIFSVYMHLSKFGNIEVVQKTKRGEVVKKKQLRAGDIVERGQVIGFSGTTGAGARRDPHLHWSMRNNGIYIDPCYFIDTVNQHLK